MAAKTPKEDVLPTNYEVLQRELPILDVMTGEPRPAHLGGRRAARADLKIDDSNTPPFVDAKTNLPGRVRRSSTARRPSRR